MELGTLKEAEAGECLVEVSCMKTIQDKLRTRITTIRTLRDSLFLIASRKGHTHTNKYRHSICAILDFCTHNTQCKWDCDCDCNCESGNLSQTLETQTPIIQLISTYRKRQMTLKQFRHNERMKKQKKNGMKHMQQHTYTGKISSKVFVVIGVLCCSFVECILFK